MFLVQSRGEERMRGERCSEYNNHQDHHDVCNSPREKKQNESTIQYSRQVHNWILSNSHRIGLANEEEWNAMMSTA